MSTRALEALDRAIKKISKELDLGGQLFYEPHEKGLVLVLSHKHGAAHPLVYADTLDELTAYVEGMRKAAYLLKNKEARLIT